VKYFIVAAVLLFGTIGVMGWMKNRPATPKAEPIQEFSLGTSSAPIPIPTGPTHSDPFQEIDRIAQLFALDSSDLSSIVETVSFTSRVPWLKDRPAWIADYASHYQTSRHFIARSLNQKTDYLNQKVHPGDRFNVFRKDKNIRFHLLVDLSKCRMWFYCLDGNEKILLKTYRVGVGKVNSHTASGFTTPLGKYTLGEKVAIYKPGVTGYFQDDKVEMIRVFGTRWIPFDKEVEGKGEQVKGLGIHGLPWLEATDGLVEDRSKIGKYDSDGCIRMASEDVEEIFAIVITKPTTVEIVKEFKP
jgi:hypothetical protein